LYQGDQNKIDPIPEIKDLNGDIYPLAADLYKLWQFAKGNLSLDNKIIDTICHKCIELYWDNPVKKVDVNTIEMGWWSESIVGSIIRVARARLKLNKDKDLSAPELVLISGIPIETINKWTRKRKLVGKKIGKNWFYSPYEVNRVLKMERIGIEWVEVEKEETTH